MKFWDSSAVVPLLHREPTSERIEQLYAAEPTVTVWMMTPLEIASALNRKRRGGVPEHAFLRAQERLAELSRHWIEVQEALRIRDRARRLVDTHPLTAADSLQLAAALVATEEKPQAMGFVTLDAVLGEAARREGFAVEGI